MFHHNPKDEKRMADENTLFNVIVKAEIKTTDGSPFASEIIEYSDMAYDDVMDVESCWDAFHRSLVQLGPKKAKQKKDKKEKKR